MTEARLLREAGWLVLSPSAADRVTTPVAAAEVFAEWTARRWLKRRSRR